MASDPVTLIDAVIQVVDAVEALARAIALVISILKAPSAR